jgi:transcriptional regulator with XRE-family HTH domain
MNNKNSQLYPVATAQAQPLEVLPEPLVSQCKSGAMAMRQTTLSSGFAQEELANRIGKAREVLSRACNGRGGLDIDTLIKLMNESGSVFLLQYMAYKMGGKFTFYTQEEIELMSLKKRMNELQAPRQIYLEQQSA